MILLPFPSFRESAAYLTDYYVTTQIYHIRLCIIQGGSKDFIPLWRYHGHSLASYGIEHVKEVHKRGLSLFIHDQTSYKFFKRIQEKYLPLGPPEWVGDEEIHASHKEFIDKDQRYYIDGLVMPEVNLKARLKSLQPRIKEEAKKKKLNAQKETQKEG